MWVEFWNETFYDTTMWTANKKDIILNQSS